MKEGSLETGANVPNGKLTSGQWDYVNGIAKDFDFNTFDDLAVFLGFRDSDHLANECFAGADLYSCLASPGNTARYMQIEKMLHESGR